MDARVVKTQMLRSNTMNRLRRQIVNALEDALEAGERPVREVYGANYERLRALKRKYDPSNLFSQNTNINPT